MNVGVSLFASGLRGGNALVKDITAAPYNLTAGADITTILQQACDDAAAVAPAIVFIPPSIAPWVISNTVFLDKPGVSVVGLPGSQIHANQYSPCDPFAIGVQRVNTAGHSITAASLYQSGGIYFVRTTGDGGNFLQVQNHPLQYGPAHSSYGWPYYSYWGDDANLKQLTYDLVFGPDPNTPWSPGQFLFGSGDAAAQYTSYPVTFWTGLDPNHILCCVRTGDILFGAGNPDHQATITVGGLTPPYKIQVTIDLVTAQVKAYDWSTGSRVDLGVSLTPSWAAPGGAFNTNNTFATNTWWPFFVANRGKRGIYGAAPTPMLFGGYHVRQGIFSDGFNPWTPTSATVAYFPQFTANSIISGRQLAVGTGPAQGSFGYFAYWMNASDYGTPPDSIRLEGLNIQNAPGKGAAVLLGASLDVDILGCKLMQGGQGVGCLNIQENYLNNIQNCTVQGYDTGLYGFFCISNISNVRTRSCGRDIMRFVGGDVGISDGFSSNNNTNQASVFSFYGADNGAGNVSVRRWRHNAEGNPMSTCPVYQEQAAYGFTGLELTNVDFGQSRDIPAIILQRQSDVNTTTWRAGHARITNMGPGTYTPMVRILGGSPSPNDRPNNSATGLYNDEFDW